MCPENLNQSTNANHCSNCGNLLSSEANCCSNCGTPISNDEPNSPKKRSKKKIIIPIVIFFIMIAIGIAVFFLFETHVICIDHSWSRPTCTEPAKCIYCGKNKGNTLGKHKWKKANCTTPKTCRHCDKTEGEPLGHDWTEATCTEDSICKICAEVGEKATGHIEGSWTETKEATLVDVGVEEILCTVCSESLNSRSTEKKKPQVVGSSFNFKDSEFIDWLEDNSTLMVGSKQTLNSTMNTAYLLTNSDGKTGALLLNHGDNGLYGNICSIMIYFDNSTYSVATIAYIGEELDSSFVKEDAALKLSYDQSYTKASMTTMMLDVQGMSTATLAPTEFFYEILS